jgi:hypothetical protein
MLTVHGEWPALPASHDGLPPRIRPLFQRLPKPLPAIHGLRGISPSLDKTRFAQTRAGLNLKKGPDSRRHQDRPTRQANHLQTGRVVTLKKLIVLAVICFGAWNYYQREYLHVSSTKLEQHESIGNLSNRGQGEPRQDGSRFRCDGRQYCSQMISRDEAVFFVKNCPNTKMDGDHDGIPCENDSRF